jgi:hypothetical protein
MGDRGFVLAAVLLNSALSGAIGMAGGVVLMSALACRPPSGRVQAGRIILAAQG